jgi:sn-glycerol 3-phosphate transport system ATP-binding protein
MGRAIVREPAVFLFDEPLSNLDAKLRVQMRLEIKELQAKLGVTSLYVTHDQVEAMTMADRMIVMNSGVAEQVGTPLDVYQKPRTLFAAQFIGSPAMNVVDGVLKSGTATLFNGAKLKTTSNQNGDVSIGIRPEHVRIDPKGPIEMSVISNEPLGANTLLHGKLKDGDEMFTASLPGVHRLSRDNDTIRLSMDASNVHVFDRKTALRLD